MGAGSSVPIQSPYFIQNKDNLCLAALGDSYVRFIDCDGKEIDDKLWISETDAIRNVKTDRCLGLKDACSASKLDLVFAADSAPARLYPCDQLKGKLTWHDNNTRLCCPKGDNQRACLSFKTVNKDGHAVNLVDPNPDKKIYVTAHDKYILQGGCCFGNITGKVCGPFKPGSSWCDEVYDVVCAPGDMSNVVGDSVPGPAIVTEPQCAQWCARNPTKCDKTKFEFCRSVPDHPLCDCINADQRPGIKALMSNLPDAASGVPMPCFLQSRCSDVDLYNVLVPESTRKLQEYCPQHLIDMTQLVDCSGAVCYNVTAEQDVDVETRTETEAPETPEIPAPTVTPKPTGSGEVTPPEEGFNMNLVVFLFAAVIIAVAIVWYRRSGAPRVELVNAPAAQ